MQVFRAEHLEAPMIESFEAFHADNVRGRHMTQEEKVRKTLLEAGIKLEGTGEIELVEKALQYVTKGLAERMIAFMLTLVPKAHGQDSAASHWTDRTIVRAAVIKMVGMVLKDDFVPPAPEVPEDK
jgi:hypothetical protein